MNNHIINAKYHAKELDQGVDMAIDRISKMPDSTGIAKSFLELLRLIKSESKLVVESLERATMSRMFPFITMTWNPFTGSCPYECSYCWAKSLIKRYKWPKYLTSEPGVDEKQINKKFLPRDFVFVQDMSDASTATFEAVRRVMLRVETNPETKFLFLVKNPSCYLEWIKSDETKPPKNTILGVTIETNDSGLLRQFSKAPPAHERIEALFNLSSLGFKTFVSVEPIMDFNREQLSRCIKLIEPWAVAVGYDNYHNNLPEPPLSKTRAFIADLEYAGIKVYRKTLRESISSKELRRTEP